MKIVPIMLTAALAGCGASNPPKPSNTPQNPPQQPAMTVSSPEPQTPPPSTPEPAPPTNTNVPHPTNIDVLRIACPHLSDSKIVELTTTIDESWQAGLTLDQQYAVNDDACRNSTPICTICFDAAAEFVYLVVH